MISPAIIHIPKLILFCTVYNFDTPEYYLYKEYNEQVNQQYADLKYSEPINQNLGNKKTDIISTSTKPSIRPKRTNSRIITIKDNEDLKHSVKLPKTSLLTNDMDSTYDIFNQLMATKEGEINAYNKSQEVLLKFYKEDAIGIVHMYILQNFNFKMTNHEYEGNSIISKNGIRRLFVGLLICCIREIINPKYIKQILTFSVVSTE